MRAVRFYEHGGPEVLRIEDIPIPEVRPGTVLVRTVAAGLNFADVLQRQGAYVDPVQLPTTAGLELAGEVVAVGAGVEGLTVGERVVGLARGAFAEYARTFRPLLFPIPEGLDWAEAVALPIQGLTAYLGLRTAARLEPGERVLVQAAAGGVGILAVQVAKCLGAGTVYATASTDEKLALAREHGADVTINYEQEDFVARIKELTENKGVHVIMDGVGGEVLVKSLHCLATFGRLVSYGRARGEPANLDVTRLVPQSLTVMGFYLPRYLQRPGLAEVGMADLRQWCQERRLRVVVGQKFALADVAEAERALAERRTVGKVVLQVA